MIVTYKGVWCDKSYLIASEKSCREVHKALGIPYYNGLRTKGVSDKEIEIAVSNLETVFTKPVSGVHAYKAEIV